MLYEENMEMTWKLVSRLSRISIPSLSSKVNCLIPTVLERVLNWLLVNSLDQFKIVSLLKTVASNGLIWVVYGHVPLQLQFLNCYGRAATFILETISRKTWFLTEFPLRPSKHRSSSTYTNAAIVLTLLSSRARSTVVFLEFKSAFNIVDHQRLENKLVAKVCPATLLALIQSLMFFGLESRILINSKVTGWFPRSRGVL
jgi:hypothetical protein